MCSIWETQTARVVREALPKKDKAGIVRRLNQMAGLDSVNLAAGLELILHDGRVDDWSDPNNPRIKPLKNLRKYQYGRHRLYIAGRNTDCRFDLIYILSFKTTKDDNPGGKAFQKRVISALASPHSELPAGDTPNE